MEINKAYIIIRKIKEEFSRLDEREQTVLSLRTGISFDKPLILEEVGKKFNVTRERIRQIEAKAFEKLRIKVGEELTKKPQ